MEIKYTNNKEDMYNYFQFYKNHQTVIKTYKKFKLILIMALGLFISLSIVLFNWRNIQGNGGLSPEDLVYIITPTVIALLIVIIAMLLSNVFYRENFEDIIKQRNINFEQEVKLTVEEDGIHLEEGNISKKYYWNGIKDIKEYENSIFILLNQNKVIIIPNEAFTDGQVSKEDLIKNIKNQL